MTSLALLYLIGEPGVGKSSTMRALTAGLDRMYHSQPLHHEMIAPPDGRAVALELGRTRPGFPGTDTLALNASPRAIAFVASRPAPLILAEGDRLAHVGFLEAADKAGYRVHVAYLHADAEVVEQRCAGRGSTQNEAWRRGRASKAANLFAYASTTTTVRIETMMVYTAGRTPTQVANTIRAAWPFLDVLGRPAVPA